MFCPIFFALLGLALAGPIDFEADLNHNVDLRSLQKVRLKNLETVEAEIELLKATYAKTVIEPPAPFNGATIEDEDANELNKKSDDDHLVEGDILLTNAQLAAIETSHNSKRSRRQALKDKSSLWGYKNVIPYNYSATYPKETRGPVITAAMKFWEKNTCVRFKEVTSGYRVEIRDWDGCSASLGNTHSDTGTQYLNLGEGCIHLGLVCHELMHTFGFLHTHMRFDRDEYIDIDYENILDKNAYNMVSEDDYVLHGIPYEFGSVMHYDHKDEAKDDRQPVLYAKPAYKIYQGGMQGRMPTFYDILAVNRHFNCFAKCGISVKCANGGVQNVNNCKKCLCTTGWTGDDCSERPNNTTTIAVTSELTTKIISINSTAPDGMNVQMTPKVLTRRHRDKLCMDMGIEVKFLRDQRYAGLQVCDANVKHPTITSETNEMLVQAYTLGLQFDVELQFKAVKPAEKCKISVACANGGVQDVNNCSKCICPVGWIGKTCDQRPELTKLFANSTFETRSIFMHAGTNTSEYYLITAPPGMKVQMIPVVRPTDVDNLCNPMGIEVKYLQDQRQAGLRVCDGRVQQPTITSDTNEMLVHAYTLGKKFAAALRFKAVYATEKCKTSVACANGGVQDMNVCIKCICPLGWIGDTCDQIPELTKLFAENKSEKVEIRMPVGTTTTQHRVEYYLIKAPPGMKVQMIPEVRATDLDSSCNAMGIEVKYLKDQRQAGLRVCPSTAPPTITSETNEMLVQAYTLEDEFLAELQFTAVKSAEKCKTSLACANGGIQDVNVCTKCRCEPGWIGDTCEERPDLAELFAKNESEKVEIRMPLGTNTTQYRVKYYVIKGPTGMKIQMTPKILSDSKSCDSMGIKVEFVRNQRPAGIRVCPSTEPPTVTSETNEMLVHSYTLENEFLAELQFKAVN